MLYDAEVFNNKVNGESLKIKYENIHRSDFTRHFCSVTPRVIALRNKNLPDLVPTLDSLVIFTTKLIYTAQGLETDK